MENRSPWHSYMLNDVAQGCKSCVKGEKLVLFISGVCSRSCFYCSLSNERKNIDTVFANERPCKSPSEAVQEAIESNAKGAGITGGDPLLFLERTIEYSKALKEKLGKDFHIHIYLPTNLLSLEALQKLHPFVDEVRFHPRFLIGEELKEEEDIQKIKQASEIFGKNNTGIELPMLPDKKEKILSFVKKVGPYISFLNLNELEISDTNLDIMNNNYAQDKEDYAIPGSIKSGLWIIRELKKEDSKLKVHLCTAETKMTYQFKNRLLKHSLLPNTEKTKEGMMKYFAICAKDEQEFLDLTEKFKGEKVYLDKRKLRIILTKKLAKDLIRKYKIQGFEEYPTFDRIEVLSWEAN